MNVREKFQLNLPLYLVLGVLFSVAVWSLWLPRWLGNVENVEAALTSFSTSQTAVSKVPLHAQMKMIYRDGVYAMVFTSSTSGASPTSSCANVGSQTDCKLYYIASSDGISWNAPVLISSAIGFNYNGETIADFSYDTRRAALTVVYKSTAVGGVVQSYSTDGGSNWTTITLEIGSGNPQSIGDNPAIAYATSSNLRAMLFQRDDKLLIATSTSLSAENWPTSTIQSVANYYDTSANNYSNAKALGVSIDSANTIHAVYSLSTTTAAGGYEIKYAVSTDLGQTWTISSISGVLASNLSGNCFECYTNAASIDPYTGRLKIIYQYITAVNMGTPGVFLATTSVRYGQLEANGTWTTSTLQAAVPISITYGSSDEIGFRPGAIISPYPSTYFAAYSGTSSLPYLAFSTSTLVQEQINSAAIPSRSEISLAYNADRQHLGFVYVDSSTYSIKFTTTSLKIAGLNTAPSLSSTFNPSFATSGTGLVTVTTTLTEVNRETVTLYVDFSLDGGTTWASSTIFTATGASGSLSTSSGQIQGITVSPSGGTNALTFAWNSLADAPTASTTQAKLRLRPQDGIALSYNTYISSDFTVDNLPPDAPTGLLATGTGTSTIAFSFTAPASATYYMVSSTAASTFSTSSVSVTSTSLSPNTRYLFQVKAQDLFSNTSSYSITTSTYTNPAVPTSVSASDNGTTSLIVTWSANSNGSGTVYELYNVTAGAVVATTTETTYTVTGLTAATAYQFKVRAQYLADSSSYSSYSDNSAGVSTAAASSSSSSGGGGGSVPAAIPLKIPPSAPTSESATTLLDLTLGAQVKQKIGASEHTYTAISTTPVNMRVKIQSEPIVVDLVLNTPRELDTDNKFGSDLRVTYKGLKQGKASLLVTTLVDEGEYKNPLTINGGAYQATSRSVKLSFNLSGITQVAVSNSSDFLNSVFQAYDPNLNWELSAGNGSKVVYARVRNAQGSMATVSDMITLVSSGVVDVTTPVEIKPPITNPPSTSAIPVLKRTLKRNMSGVDVKQLQAELQKQGYFPKKMLVSNLFGPTTEASVKAFEKSKGLKVDGIVDVATWTVIFGGSAVTTQPPTSTPVVRPTLNRGNTGANVLWVQQKLQSLGYFPKNTIPNGVFGPTTQSSVRAFQKANGISQVGFVGPLTWTALNK